MGASRVLGIIGICLGWLIPIVGITLGIIGLSIKKEKGREDKDWNLNTISLIEGIFAFIFWILMII